MSSWCWRRAPRSGSSACSGSGGCRRRCGWPRAIVEAAAPAGRPGGERREMLGRRVVAIGAVLGFMALGFMVLGAGRTMADQVKSGGTPERLRALAHDYFAWRNERYPVASSDQGLHTWDDRLADYAAAAVASRREHVKRLLAEVKGM